jgi:septal ring factor EnvC (AmiA/AmiB activator)
VICKLHAAFLPSFDVLFGKQEQLELLELENDLLVQQQEDLDAEVQRLHGQLQSADTALADARADAAVAAERVAAASQREKERSKISNSLRHAKERCRVRLLSWTSGGATLSPGRESNRTG